MQDNSSDIAVNIKKKHWWQFFNVFIIVAAYCFLIYKLCMFDGYATFAEYFKGVGVWQIAAIIVAIMLIPLNIFFDAAKWKYLLRKINPMSWKEAQRQTYFGFIGAFITPSRLGDYPTRATLINDKNNWLAAVALGFVGTFAMDMVIIITGLPSILFFFAKDDTSTGQMWMALGCMLLFVMILLLYRPIITFLSKKSFRSNIISQTIKTLSSLSLSEFLMLMIISLLRYSVWFVQLWLVMMFCGINFTFTQLLIAIPAYYVLITVTPGIPLADAAIRGSWSIIVFSAFSDNTAAIAMAAVMLWLINTIIPMLVGTLIRKKNKELCQ